MADFNKPTVDSEYTQFPTEIRAAISAALSFLKRRKQKKLLALNNPQPQP